MAFERRRVIYSGTVQGVGFRWTTASALRGLPVAGYVKNLPSGQVELVLEGEQKDNEQALQRVREALSRHIRLETQETAAPTGEFSGFSVRR